MYLAALSTDGFEEISVHDLLIYIKGIAHERKIT